MGPVNGSGGASVEKGAHRCDPLDALFCRSDKINSGNVRNSFPIRIQQHVQSDAWFRKRRRRVVKGGGTSLRRNATGEQEAWGTARISRQQGGAHLAFGGR
jgi:hypothetical protein